MRDLIDLLSWDDATGMKGEVQTREGKESHILLVGLQEVNVKHAGEDMRHASNFGLIKTRKPCL